MEKKRVALSDVKLTWSGFENDMSREACEAKDIPSFLVAVRGNQGPYAYDKIAGLLTEFCDKEGNELVAEYEKKLKRQLRPRVMPVRQTGKRFRVKVDRELRQERDTEILDFRSTLAALFECTAVNFLLEDVRDGCIQLTYIIPSTLAEKLRESNLRVRHREFKQAKILELWLERYA